jgi:hypothetical protein
MDRTQMQAWSMKCERDRDQIPEARRERHAIVDAIRAGDVDGFLDKVTKRDATFDKYFLERHMLCGELDYDQRQAFRNA